MFRIHMIIIFSCMVKIKLNKFPTTADFFLNQLRPVRSSY